MVRRCKCGKYCTFPYIAYFILKSDEVYIRPAHAENIPVAGIRLAGTGIYSGEVWVEQPDVLISSGYLWVEQPDVLRAAAYADADAYAQQTQTQTPSRSRAAPSARI
ncbi:MAG: hypothetical protein GY820_20700, partial [Gammaproteobacteria bacterium]|nr:hypothetical protein [Gammaproteobacteria bacterium]